MATIDKITLPSTGQTYDIKDNVSGYVTAQTAPVTSVNGMTGDVVVGGGGGSYTATAPIDITSDVISHNNSGVTAGTYVGSDDGKGMEVYLPSVTVDGKGHITSASNMGYSILADTHPSAVTTDPVLVQNGHFASTLRSYNAYVLALSAGETSTSFTISTDPHAPYIAYSQFRVADVQAVDSITHEPVIVDWSTDKNYGSNITVTVSIASAWTHTLNIYIILNYAYGM